MLKCLWFLEFQRRSEEIPEQIFHYNPQREGEDLRIDVYSLVLQTYIILTLLY